jgi:hypothetical protein
MAKLTEAIFQLYTGQASEKGHGHDYPVSINHSRLFLYSTMFLQDEYKNLFQTKNTKILSI